MSSNSWNQSLITQQVDGTALASSTTKTSLLAPAAKFVLPSNLFQIGTKLILRAAGRIGTVVTTPGNFTFTVQFGGSIDVWTSGTTALNVAAQTNAAWALEIELMCRSIGASTSATLWGIGKFTSRASLNAPAVGTTTGVGTVLLPDTSPTTGTGFDSTASQTVDLMGTWSVSNASNTIRCDSYELILCN